MKEFSNVWLVAILLVVAIICAVIGLFLLMSSKQKSDQTQLAKEKDNKRNTVHRALADSTETKIYITGQIICHIYHLHVSLKHCA